MYLTRDEAAARLAREDRITEAQAHSVLDDALAAYPQTGRTGSRMITGYPEGTTADGHHPGIPEALFTVSRCGRP